MTTQSSTTLALPALARLNPFYVEVDGIYGTNRILLDDTVSATDMAAAVEELRSALRQNYAEVTVEGAMQADRHVINVSVYSSSRNRHDLKAELIKLVGPKFADSASASAKVRRGNGRHNDGQRIGVVVTLSLPSDGNGPRPSDDEVANAVDGVSRLRSRGNGRITFSLTDYADPEVDVTSVTREVAAQYGAYLTEAVTADDSQADNDLLVAYDVSSRPSATTAE